MTWILRLMTWRLVPPRSQMQERSQKLRRFRLLAGSVPKSPIPNGKETSLEMVCQMVLMLPTIPQGKSKTGSAILLVTSAESTVVPRKKCNVLYGRFFLKSNKNCQRKWQTNSSVLVALILAVIMVLKSLMKILQLILQLRISLVASLVTNMRLRRRRLRFRHSSSGRSL